MFPHIETLSTRVLLEQVTQSNSYTALRAIVIDDNEDSVSALIRANAPLAADLDQRIGRIVALYIRAPKEHVEHSAQYLAVRMFNISVPRPCIVLFALQPSDWADFDEQAAQDDFVVISLDHPFTTSVPAFADMLWSIVAAGDVLGREWAMGLRTDAPEAMPLRTEEAQRVVAMVRRLSSTSRPTSRNAFNILRLIASFWQTCRGIPAALEEDDGP